MPAVRAAKRPMGGIAGEQIRRYVLPRRILDVAGDVRHTKTCRHKRLEEPATVGIRVLLELASREAQLLAQLDAEANGVVPQYLAGATLHHLRADIERG